MSKEEIIKLIENSNGPIPIFVITDVESGWDCVRGVFFSKQDAIDHLEEDGEPYIEGNSSKIIHDKYIWV